MGRRLGLNHTMQGLVGALRTISIFLAEQETFPGFIQGRKRIGLAFQNHQEAGIDAGSLVIRHFL